MGDVKVGKVQCECSKIFNGPFRCDWEGDKEDTIRIDHVPDYLRGTAKAAGTVAGVTERYRVNPGCVEELLANEPDWTWEV